MIIKIATLNDINELCELLNTLFEQEVEFRPNKKLQTKGLKMILENEDIGHILVAKIDEETIGMVSLLYTISTALGSKSALLEDMVIKSQYRDNKCGTALLSYAKELAIKQGCKRITLLTDKDNVIAQNFYKKNKFCESSMIPFRLKL